MNERKGFLIMVTGLLGILAYLMVRPFLGYFLAAVLLAFMLHPLYRAIRPRFGSTISAFLLVIFAIALVLIPFIYTTFAVLDDAQGLADDVNRSDIINTTQIEENIEEYTGRSVNIEAAIESSVDRFTGRAVGSFSQVLGIITNLAIGVTLMLFLLYYMIKDGESFISWLKDIIPLPTDIQRDLQSEIKTTSWAVLQGHVLVAILQGLVAGIGLVVTGVPNAFFWTFVMVILGFIPIIGTLIVWLPASIYLFLIDKVPEAIFLAVYGFTIVSLTDNIIRPLAVDRSSGLHPAVIIIGVIGGVYIFGAIGLFIGPILLGILKSILLVYKDQYQDL